VDEIARFHAFIGGVARPMLIVTTAAGSTRAGCLVGFHSQCGIDPAQYAVWLSKANRTFEIGVLADTFAVHFLDEQDRQLAELFGGVTGDDEDKFAECAWHEGPQGVPLLDDCTVRVTMRRVALHDAGGDHACFVLAPVTVDTPDTFRPLASTSLGNLEAGHAPDERRLPD
jgi:flavin reductase (DIM6/NTAB) family NADH-FMN oxidoreductase RutF